MPQLGSVLAILALILALVHGTNKTDPAKKPLLQHRPQPSKLSFPRITTNLTALALPLYHTSNEGSSAMVQQIAELKPCVFQLGELLERRFFNETASKIVGNVFFHPDGIKPQLLYETMVRWAEPKFIKNIGNAEDVLQKAQQCLNKGFKTLIIAKFRGLSCLDQATDHITHYFAIRTDILRCGLSQYRDQNLADVPTHPQFQKNFTAPAIRYEMKIFDKAVMECAGKWKYHFNNMDALLRKFKTSCSHLKILHYEDFNIDPRSFMERWYNTAIAQARGLSALADPAAPRMADRFVVSKAHPDDITQFVLNSGEILTAFMFGDYPYFGAELKNAVKNKFQMCQPSDFMISV